MNPRLHPLFRRKAAHTPYSKMLKVRGVEGGRTTFAYITDLKHKLPVTQKMHTSLHGRAQATATQAESMLGGLPPAWACPSHSHVSRVNVGRPTSCMGVPEPQPCEQSQCWEAYLLHELEEDVQQLRYEGLHLLQALSVKSINEAAQCHHRVHPYLHVE